jgi:DnaK suppressor protein
VTTTSRDDAPSLFPSRRALTDKQRAHILLRLLEERKAIVSRLARYASESASGGSTNRVPLHMADVGSETMQETLDAALASRDSRTLAEIDDALRRFYHDPETFGVDDRTGAPIAFERLDIIPWTRQA